MHIAVCHERGLANEALVAATMFRRSGMATDYMIGGKPDKQFARAKRDGATEILTIRHDGARLWFSWRDALEGPLKDLQDYLLWIYDDTEVLPDPPDWTITPDNPFSQASALEILGKPV